MWLVATALDNAAPEILNNHNKLNDSIVQFLPKRDSVHVHRRACGRKF